MKYFSNLHKNKRINLLPSSTCYQTELKTFKNNSNYVIYLHQINWKNNFNLYDDKLNQNKLKLKRYIAFKIV